MIHIKRSPIALSDLQARCMSLLLAGVLSLAAAPAALAQSGPQKLRAIPLNAGMHLIQAELAQTPRQREIGLMFRKEMAAHEGMLFVFDQPGTQCFWMKNTFLPLSAAFVADDGTIVNIVEMTPLSETSLCSAKPVRFVLEMNQGWFAKIGYKAGSRLTGAPFGQK